MKIINQLIICTIILIILTPATQSRSIYRRRLSLAPSDDWQKEFIKSELSNNKSARGLQSRKNWVEYRKLNRDPKEAKRIKREIANLKRKLAKIDKTKKTKRFFKNMKNHEKETRNLKRTMTKHLNQNTIRALILQQVLGNSNQVGNMTPNQLNPFIQQPSNLPLNQSDQKVEVTPQIRSLLLKNLTMQDFDTIAKNKLTVTKYNDLIASTEDLPLKERKQRFLNVVVDTVSSTLSGVVGTIGGVTNAVSNIVASPAGKYLGMGTLGVFAGLKHHKNNKFIHKRERLLKQIEMYDTVNTLIDEEKRGANKTADYISNLVVRAKSIADNLSYRFDNKCRLFGSAVV